ncbi:MAG: hypothetical protein DMD66_13510 [Gemmatimonadetes bacterium]|nr:MAG: hypothetical protein DMD66_13510 [Gemmatimonadota bacterium]
MAEPFVAFNPIAPASGNAARRGIESFTFRLIDQDHFTWSPIDRSWRAVFTRALVSTSNAPKRNPRHRG